MLSLSLSFVISPWTSGTDCSPTSHPSPYPLYHVYSTWVSFMKQLSYLLQTSQCYTNSRNISEYLSENSGPFGHGFGCPAQEIGDGVHGLTTQVSALPWPIQLKHIHHDCGSIKIFVCADRTRKGAGEESNLTSWIGSTSMSIL
jgi:hypothetical protein